MDVVLCLPKSHTPACPWLREGGPDPSFCVSSLVAINVAAVGVQPLIDSVAQFLLKWWGYVAQLSCADRCDRRIDHHPGAGALGRFETIATLGSFRSGLLCACPWHLERDTCVAENSVFQNLIVLPDLHEMSLVAIGSFIIYSFSFAKIYSFFLSCVPQCCHCGRGRKLIMYYVFQNLICAER
jgi:hypothetical protein